MLDELIKSEQKEIQVIIFALGSEEYAIPIESVQEIILPQKVTRIPKSPEYIKGFINLRGTIIPVSDGKTKYNLKSNENNLEKDKRIMVIETEQETSGLIVDNVNEVITLNIKEIEPLPIDMEENSNIFWGIGKYQSRLLILVKPETFMSIEEDIINIQSNVSRVTEVIKQATSVV